MAYREFWLQRGSFGLATVGYGDSNPEWKNRPFRVIEYAAYKELKEEIEFAIKYLEATYGRQDIAYCPELQMLNSFKAAIAGRGRPNTIATKDESLYVWYDQSDNTLAIVPFSSFTVFTDPGSYMMFKLCPVRSDWVYIGEF
jgi:hypothetical protein